MGDSEPGREGVSDGMEGGSGQGMEKEKEKEKETNMGRVRAKVRAADTGAGKGGPSGRDSTETPQLGEDGPGQEDAHQGEGSGDMPEGEEDGHEGTGVGERARRNKGKGKAVDRGHVEEVDGRRQGSGQGDRSVRPKPKARFHGALKRKAGKSYLFCRRIELMPSAVAAPPPHESKPESESEKDEVVVKREPMPRRLAKRVRKSSDRVPTDSDEDMAESTPGPSQRKRSRRTSLSPAPPIWEWDSDTYGVEVDSGIEMTADDRAKGKRSEKKKRQNQRHYEQAQAAVRFQGGIDLVDETNF